MSSQENVVPIEVSSKFNWGACLLSTPWCIRYGVWRILGISIVAFIISLFLSIINPWFFVLSIVTTSIYYGIKGNAWAWKNGNFTSAKKFLHAQKIWGIVGLIVPIFFGTMFIFLVYMLNYSVAVKESLHIANNNESITDYFGSPITRPSAFQGSISESLNTIFCVDLKVAGPKNDGYLIIDAKKVDNEWVPARIVVTNLNREVQIESVNEDMLMTIIDCRKDHDS